MQIARKSLLSNRTVENRQSRCPSQILHMFTVILDRTGDDGRWRAPGFTGTASARCPLLAQVFRRTRLSAPPHPNPSSPPNENGIPLHLGFENSRLFAAGPSAPGPSMRLSRLGSSLSPAPPEPTRRVLSPRPILQSRIGVNARAIRGNSASAIP